MNVASVQQCHSEPEFNSSRLLYTSFSLDSICHLQPEKSGDWSVRGFLCADDLYNVWGWVWHLKEPQQRAGRMAKQTTIKTAFHEITAWLRKSDDVYISLSRWETERHCFPLSGNKLYSVSPICLPASSAKNWSPDSHTEYDSSVSQNNTNIATTISALQFEIWMRCTVLLPNTTWSECSLPKITKIPEYLTISKRSSY